MNILNSIQKIIKKNYPQIKDKIDMKTILGDIEYLDSLELATIAVELEEQFGFRFPDQDLEKIKEKTVEEIITDINRLIKEKK